MTDISAHEMKSEAIMMDTHSPGVVWRSVIIGLTAFLTVVDLFATQAILPSLTRHYQVTPAAMGFAVNATTMGMAAAVAVEVGTSRATKPSLWRDHPSPINDSLRHSARSVSHG